MKLGAHLPSPAMVVACIALCVALTGTAFAAGLGKNSVGSRQLKKNAVTNTKIKRSAVTSSKVRNDSLTGSDINESALGQVPSAHAADSASSAQSATTAQNVDGFRVAKLSYHGAADSVPAQFFSGGGLTLTGSCVSGAPDIIATTSEDDSAIHVGLHTFDSVTAADEGTISTYAEDDTFNIGDNYDLAADAAHVLPGSVKDSVEATLTFATPSGSVVTATFLIERQDPFLGQSVPCHVVGTATFG